MTEITIPQNAKILTIAKSENKIVIEFSPGTSWIAEARKKGFVKGAKISSYNDLRIMTNHKLIEYDNGNIITTGSHPFWIRFRGKWVAEVLNSKK